MGKIRLSYPNRLADATWSGPRGAWSTASPPNYMQTRQIAQVARTLSADPRCAYLYADAGSAGAASVFALAGHNLTVDGQWRVRGFSESPIPVIDLYFGAGQMPAGVTFARSTTATYITAGGLLATAAIDEPRYSYSGSTLRGLLLEGEAINKLLWSRDGTNAAWSKTTMTTAKTATGVDGVANSATRLTATGASSNIRQTPAAVSSASYVFSVYLRRVSGSGTVNLTMNNFSSVTAVTLTTSWQRFSIRASGYTGNVIGIQIVTSGDVIEMDCSQLELGLEPSSVVITTTAEGSRARDVVTFADAGAAGASMSSGALHLRGWHGASTGATPSLIVGLWESASEFVGMSGGNDSLAARVEASSSTTASISIIPSLVAGDPINVAMSWATNDVRAAAAGALGTADTSATMATASGTFDLTLGHSAAVRHCLTVEHVRVYSRTMTDAELQSLSQDADDTEIVAGYDSGMVDAWDADWVAATTADERDGVRPCSLIVPTSAQTYRYWRIDLSDSTNADGYLEVGRAFAGTAWQPTYNAIYGSDIGYESRDQIAETDSGSEYVRARPGPRVARLQLQAMSDSSAIGGLLQIIRRQGTSGELLFEWDADGGRYGPERTFLARMSSTARIACDYLDMHSTTAEVRELI